MVPLRQRAHASAGQVFRAIPQPGPGRPPVRSLYLHVPFCHRKCDYCDFYSVVDRRDRQAAFVDRLTRELAAIAPWAAGVPLETIFVGGGTPTLLALPLWSRLLDALHRLFDLSAMSTGTGEFTVECNPETASAELFACLRAGGVNRISFGAQSFDPRHLRTLGRWHAPDAVPRAIQLAREAGLTRLSIDLIFAIPGQTLADVHRDLHHALGCGVQHLSYYNLTYEAGTAMTARLQRGLIRPCPESLELRMYRAVVRTLASAGLARYEISNFAAPGQMCRHNLVYWRGGEWLAAGPAAAGHVAGHRWKNVPRLDDYLGHDDGGFAPIVEHEPPDARRTLAETILMGLRLAEGLPAGRLRSQADRLGPAVRDRLERELQHQCDIGLLQHDASPPSEARWVLTESGFVLADAVVRDLIGALDGA